MIKNRIRFLVFFVLIFYLIVFLFLIIIFPKKNNEKLYKPGYDLFFRYGVKNGICDQELYGEPLESDNNFVKINFYCDNGKSSKNTISLNVLDVRSIENIIQEISRINNFELDNSFNCYLEGNLINNKDKIVVSGETIDCLSPKIEIRDIYKNETK